MRAMTITDDHQLLAADVPEPVPGPGEVLVDVVAAGVNRADLAQVAGHYPPPPGASPLPGLEISGHRRDTGETVVALLAGGGYAEVVAVPEGQVLPAPDGLDLADAAGLVEVAATVVSNLVGEAGLLPGSPGGPAAGAPRSLLVHGGNGGIGSFAVQFAHAYGIPVMATVRSSEGADVVYDRNTTDVVDEVRTRGGVDVILDVIGGPALRDNVRMLREHGTLVVIGTIGGGTGTIDLGALMARRARVVGTTLRSRPSEEKALILDLTEELVWPLVADGTVQLPVQHLPLGQAVEAHAVLVRGGHHGKVVLDVRG
jgi:putative PIG3 family NAD(P)H quinone oxidoreductase